MEQFSGTYISRTTGPIYFIFGMYGRISGGHKICEFNRNQPSGGGDMRG